MKIVLALVSLAALFQVAVLQQDNDKVRYDNFAVFKLKFHTKNQKELLEKLAENQNDYKVWLNTPREMHLMVSPNELEYFKNYTEYVKTQYEVMIPNVQGLIDEEQKPAELDDKKDSDGARYQPLGWTRYHPLGHIYHWLHDINVEFPNVTEGFTVGTSYEGRQINGIKISYKPGNPGIFIEANIHAREWITSATATWLLNELLTSSNPQVRQIAENYDWYIVPVFNVDGYVYTHEKDRMWRKSRQPLPNTDCIGTDLNRNFDTHWMENGGASPNPCSESFAGPQAFSEPEVKDFANYLAEIREKINVYLAFHSYSQLILSPYGHTSVQFPPNIDDLKRVAKAYANAVENLPYKTLYKYGSFGEALYIGSGTSVDWAYNKDDIKLAYTIEFRDLGHFGFVLPPAHILPNCQETMAGLLALIKDAEADAAGYLKPKFMETETTAPSAADAPAADAPAASPAAEIE